MKNSAVLASLLFGACAIAAPLNPRAMVYKTEVVVETVVVYTTVYDDQPVAQATPTNGGYFYERPKEPSASAVVPSSSSSSSSSKEAPAYTPPVMAPKPSSTYVAPIPQAPAPTPQAPAPTSQAPTPTPAPVATPKPSSAVYVAPPVVPSVAPVPVYSPPPAPVSSAAPIYSATPAPPSTGGVVSGPFTNVDMTVYDVGTMNGGLACGEAYKSSDTDYVAAVAPGVWGTSTWDRMTGASSNPNCGKMAKVNYGGKSVTVKVVDFCEGCPAGAKDIDLSWAAWNDITDHAPLDRFKVTWNWV
jgi:hypothetical protein